MQKVFLDYNNVFLYDHQNGTLKKATFKIGEPQKTIGQHCLQKTTFSNSNMRIGRRFLGLVKWESVVQKYSKQFYAVIFNQSDDKCGRPASRAKELVYQWWR
jgi:hypothetical protein